MKIRDIMTWNVVTVSSDTPIMEARKIMETHKIRRLPVVDRGKLVGVVTIDRIVGVGPSPATSLSIWETNYLLAKMTVKDIMQHNVVTIEPDASAEQAIAFAQKNKIGIMPVLEHDKLIGIVTTNDFFLKILNHVMGISKPGVRVIVDNCTATKDIKSVIEIVDKLGLKLITCHTLPAYEGAAGGFTVHVDTDDAKQLVKEIEAKGFKASISAR